MDQQKSPDYSTILIEIEKHVGVIASSVRTIAIAMQHQYPEAFTNASARKPKDETPKE